jgi:hypothetical protein
MTLPLTDDSFCVKDGSSNMLFERLTSSGLGLTIGSIGGSTVRNITFRLRCRCIVAVKSSFLAFIHCTSRSSTCRDVYMPDTFKVLLVRTVARACASKTLSREYTSNSAVEVSLPTFCTKISSWTLRLSMSQPSSSALL